VNKHIDFWTLLTLAITLILFGIALFEKGLTHDFLLEAAVFLVSVKLVIMSYKATAGIAALNSQLVAMRALLERTEH
jgi:hypothetical protein